MPAHDHQQNPNPDGGRDLGQITDLTLTIGNLIDLGRRANAVEPIGKELRARVFVAMLTAQIETAAGVAAANTFAEAIGFDHLIEE